MAIWDDVPMQDEMDTTKGKTMKASYESITRMMLRDEDTIKVGSRHDMATINIYHVIAIVAHDGMDIGWTYGKYPTWVDADRACTSHNAMYLRTHGIVCEVVNMR